MRKIYLIMKMVDGMLFEEGQENSIVRAEKKMREIVEKDKEQAQDYFVVEAWVLN